MVISAVGETKWRMRDGWSFKYSGQAGLPEKMPPEQGIGGREFQAQGTVNASWDGRTLRRPWWLEESEHEETLVGDEVRDWRGREWAARRCSHSLPRFMLGLCPQRGNHGWLQAELR